jgi:NitT/TauT family transport system permease protein
VPIAWLPFAIAVFGLTTIPQVFGVRFSGTILDHVLVGMVFILFWGAFFPILINTLDGVSAVRRNYLNLAQMLGASRTQILRACTVAGGVADDRDGLSPGARNLLVRHHCRRDASRKQ